jgi:hypothetical protein
MEWKLDASAVARTPQPCAKFFERRRKTFEIRLVSRGRDVDVLSHDRSACDAGGSGADQDESDSMALQRAQDL